LEDRFEEMKRFVGQIQSEGLYPSYVGFDRCMYYLLGKQMLPVVFAMILVFLDTDWVVILAVLTLFIAYFVLQ